MALVPKAKRRNSEKRKENSRDAARHRRSREADVFCQLSHQIPLDCDTVKILDKTSVIRLSITYLKLRALLSNGLTESCCSSSSVCHLDEKFDQLYYKTCDGFILIATSNGDILYVTENVTHFLGLDQVDIMGLSVFDLSHPCDHDELREMISRHHHLNDNNCNLSHHRKTFFIRMKSTLTNKGRNVHIKSASYKAISCSIHLKLIDSFFGGDDDVVVDLVVIVGQTIDHPSNIEVPLDSRSFVSRHNLHMKFTECDERVHELLGYKKNALIGKSVYSYHHASDTGVLEKAYKTLFYKGQVNTGIYRFLADAGGFFWLETHATVINNAITDKAECVVCINYVISELEDRQIVFDTIQLLSSQNEIIENLVETTCDVDEKGRHALPYVDEEEQTEEVEEEEEEEEDGEQTCMQFVTEKILKLVTKEENNDEAAYSQLISKDPLFHSSQKFLEMSGNEVDETICIQTTLSNSSLSSLLDKMDEDIEMRAPYLPMDDLVFSTDVEDTVSTETNSDVDCYMMSTLFNVSRLNDNNSRGIKRSFDDDMTTSMSRKMPRLIVTEKSSFSKEFDPPSCSANRLHRLSTDVSSPLITNVFDDIRKEKMTTIESINTIFKSSQNSIVSHSKVILDGVRDQAEVVMDGVKSQLEGQTIYVVLGTDESFDVGPLSTIVCNSFELRGMNDEYDGVEQPLFHIDHVINMSDCPPAALSTSTATPHIVMFSEESRILNQNDYYSDSQLNESNPSIIKNNEDGQTMPKERIFQSSDNVVISSYTRIGTQDFYQTRETTETILSNCPNKNYGVATTSVVNANYHVIDSEQQQQHWKSSEESVKLHHDVDVKCKNFIEGQREDNVNVISRQLLIEAFKRFQKEKEMKKMLSTSSQDKMMRASQHRLPLNLVVKAGRGRDEGDVEGRDGSGRGGGMSPFVATSNKFLTSPSTSVLIKSTGHEIVRKDVKRCDGSCMLMRQKPSDKSGSIQPLTDASSQSESEARTGGGKCCSSVLMNLLMKGVDINYGYRLNNSNKKQSKDND